MYLSSQSRNDPVVRKAYVQTTEQVLAMVMYVCVCACVRACVCVCMCVCVWQTDRQRQRQKERKEERESWCSVGGPVHAYVLAIF